MIILASSIVSEESTSVIDQTSRPKTAESWGPRTCSVCLQTHRSKLAYRIEPPEDTCTHKGRIRRVCDYCLYQHVINILHTSISNPVTCPEIGCSHRAFLSDEHVRRILLHEGSKMLWNSRENIKLVLWLYRVLFAIFYLPVIDRKVVRANDGCSKMLYPVRNVVHLL